MIAGRSASPSRSIASATACGDGAGSRSTATVSGEDRDPTRLVDRAAEHVHRNVEQHRPARPGERGPDRLRDQPRNIRRHLDLVGPFGDRPGDRRLVDPRLQRVGLRLSEPGRAADVEDRRAIEKGVGDRGHDVGEAGPRRDHRDAEPVAGAGIALRGMAGGDLVPRVDDRQIVIEAGLEDRIDMGAVQPEQPVDARLLQGSDEQFAAADLAHPFAPLNARRPAIGERRFRFPVIAAPKTHPARRRTRFWKNYGSGVFPSPSQEAKEGSGYDRLNGRRLLRSSWFSAKQGRSRWPPPRDSAPGLRS